MSVLLQQLNQSCRRQHREDDVNARCRRSNFFFSNVTKCNDDEMDRKMNMRGANNVGTAGTIAIVLLGFLHCCCDNNVVAFSLIARHRPEHYLPNQRIRRNRGACGWGLHNGGIRRALVWPSKAPKASGDAEEGDSSGEQEGPSSPPSLYSELDRSFAYEGRLRGSEYGNYRCGFVSILGAPNMVRSGSRRKALGRMQLRVINLFEFSRISLVSTSVLYLFLFWISKTRANQRC